MAQDWSTNFFDGDHTWSTDLQNIENALYTLRSMFSGTVAPANPLQGAPWMDTTNSVLKMYTGAAWNGIMHGDASQKLWVYRNSAMAGWVVDSSVSDRVLAFKGGTTYTTGGAASGTWTISGLSSPGATHTHTYSGNTGAPVSSGTGGLYTLSGGHYHGYSGTTSQFNSAVLVNHDGTWRAAANVGTLQYLAGL